MPPYSKNIVILAVRHIPYKSFTLFPPPSFTSQRPPAAFGTASRRSALRPHTQQRAVGLRDGLTRNAPLSPGGSPLGIRVEKR